VGERQLTAGAKLTSVKGVGAYTDLAKAVARQTGLPLVFARKGTRVLFERLDGSAWALEGPVFLHRF
jgi:hypothetical protein